MMDGVGGVFWDRSLYAYEYDERKYDAECV